ncbi:MAG: S-layer homology domain-containing protein, partial [Lachnospiraceae bacterium]|nr:S-layer homology domain-containing protein [Lachnospiraceae bacterium]
KVEEAKAIQAEGWTAASYQALQTALTEAEQLLEGTPTAQQATEMLEKLTTAIGGLTKEKEAVDTPDEIIAEVETLKAKVKEAKAIQAEGWTAASYQTLQNALTKAEQLLKGTPAAQQATEMLKQLTAAINGLTKEKAPVDKPVQKPFPFTDVKQITGNWKFESVKYVYNNDIMNGISGTTEFRPDATLTRGMFATVLYRMAGEPQITFKNTFSDVKAGKWYSNAIIWANQKGIVQGMGNGTYGVDLEITREQIAKMLNEYAKICQYDVSASKSLDSFTDAKDVSGWAVNYLKWAVAVEMIGGKPNDSEGTSYRLDPKGQATRAECAAMLMRFQNKYK